MADHCVQLRAAAAVRVGVAPRADGAVTMSEPRACRSRIARRGEAVGKPDLRGVSVRVGQRQ